MCSLRFSSQATHFANFQDSALQNYPCNLGKRSCQNGSAINPFYSFNLCRISAPSVPTFCGCSDRNRLSVSNDIETPITKIKFILAKIILFIERITIERIRESSGFTNRTWCRPSVSPDIKTIRILDSSQKSLDITMCDKCSSRRLSYPLRYQVNKSDYVIEIKSPKSIS